MALDGIDISNHNVGINPAEVPGDFVIMRASEGKGMRDEHFASYDEKIRLSSKLPGAYHFAWVGDYTGVRNTPQAEAANLAAAVKDHLRPGFMLFLDWESYKDGQGRTVDHTGNIDWAVDCALEIKRLTGRAPVLYANWSTLNRHDWSRWRREIGTEYWLAGGTGQYDDRTDGYNPGTTPDNPAGWGDPFIWQYTEFGYLGGWPKRLDLNICYGTADDWRSLSGSFSFTIPPTPATTPTQEAIVATKQLRGFPFGEPSYWTFLALEELAVLEGWCKKTLDIYQAIGGSSKSAGTHMMPGDAVDFWQSNNPTALQYAARNGGFPCELRTPAQGFAYHIHGGVKGLPNRPYNYQIAAWLAGYNGLGYQGRGGKDSGPRAGVEWRNWEAGLKYLRDRIAAKRREIEQVAEPRAAKNVIQDLPDFWNPWLAVDAWDADNPEDATLTGLSDEDLRERFIAHGFTFYQHATLHENMRFTLADLAGSWAMSNIERKPSEVAWDLLQYVDNEPPKDITWVELRPVFDAAHAGGAFGPDEGRTRHSVRAVQAGLNHLGNRLEEDGIYGPTTRGAVSDFQVSHRGAAANTSASDGVVGVHDFLHLTRLCSERTGRLHRARFLY